MDINFQKSNNIHLFVLLFMFLSFLIFTSLLIGKIYNTEWIQEVL